MDTTLSSSSFSDDADDQYLLRAVNAIEDNNANAAFLDISDEELYRFLDENLGELSPSQQAALDLDKFSDDWIVELAQKSSHSASPSLLIADEQLGNVLRQIDAYETRKLPCASNDEPIPSTSVYNEIPNTFQSLKRPSKSKGKEKAKKRANENRSASGFKTKYSRFYFSKVKIKIVISNKINLKQHFDNIFRNAVILM